MTDTSTGATSWQYNFGDNTPNATTQNPAHTYPNNGTYTVRQTVFNSNGSSSTSKQVIVGLGAIVGLKYNDVNQNGHLDPGEPGLSGWVINLSNSSGLVGTNTTAGDGTFQFNGLLPGQYTLSETVQPNYVNTSAKTLNVTLTLAQTLNVTSSFGAFGNIQLAASIQGIKYLDVNQNGTYDNGDTPLANWTINLTNSSGLVGIQVTDANGFFQFSSLTPGQYTICEIVQPGYLNTSAKKLNVTLTSGQILNVTNTFGIFGNVQLATIQGIKYLDINQNGTYDNGDTPLANWTINLTNSSGPVGAQNTDANGFFQFTGLVPGQYTISEVVQPGYLNTSAQTLNVTLTSGQVLNVTNSFDVFGNIQLATIQGIKYLDVNQNGTYDNDDTPLANWTINLTNSSGPVGSQNTDVNGFFQFTNLVPGQYTISEVLQPGYLNTSATTQNVTLSSGQILNVTNSFGVFGNIQLATVQGIKYLDVNQNGTYDNGDTPLANWTVNLTNSSGPVGIQSTDANGFFQFTNLVPGQYTISEVLQPGYLNTSAKTLNVMLTSGQVLNVTNTFGVFGNIQLASIQGIKYLDVNLNGTYDNGDTPLANWTINLVNSSGPVGTQITDINGFFQFNNLVPGNYTISEVLQPGYLNTNAKTLNVTLSSGQALNVTNTFGIFGNIQLATIQGIKYLDLNQNGTYDNGDTPLANWTIDLTTSSGPVGTQITDANGFFQFIGLVPGQYTISEVLQPGYLNTSAKTQNVTLTSGEVLNVTNTFGVFGNIQLASIQGIKYLDVNLNGTYDNGDTPLANWTINLTNSSGPVDTQITDANGFFQFTSLVPGQYTISEVVQPGYLNTSAQTLNVTLASGQVLNVTNSFGAFGNVQLATIEGLKYNDTNGNGTYDPGEQGLPNWTINLSQNNVVINSTLTNATGFFQFTNLIPGVYNVSEVLQPGFNNTNATTITVTLQSGTILNVTQQYGAFGNVQPGKIIGLKYLDINDNGTYNQNITFVTTWGGTGSGAGKFISPELDAVDSSGNVYVADTLNNRIQKFNFNGSFITQWSTASGPYGVAVDPSGNVYVACNGADLIQKFTSVGGFITQWGTNSGPRGVALDTSGNVYVACNGANLIQMFTPTGGLITQWSTSSGPFGVAVDTSGNVYVACINANIIQKFTSTGGFITQWGTVSGPTGIAVDTSSNVYVASFNSNSILKSNSTGSSITQFGSAGSGSGQFNHPIGVAVNTVGNIYVVDYGNNRVQRFGYDTPLSGWTINLFNTTGLVQTNVTDTNGTFSFGNLLPGQYTVSEVLQSGYFNTTATSVNVTLQAAQTINVTQQDSVFGNIPVAFVYGNITGLKYLDIFQNGTYVPNPAFISTWGSLGSSAGRFNAPELSAVDTSGNIYVADTNNNRIQKFNPNGDFITQWNTSSLPYGVALDTSGNVYVACFGSSIIQKFTTVGGLITQWGTSSGPRGIAIDSTGNLYVASFNTNSIQKFTTVGGLITQWGTSGNPYGVAVDTSGNVYVACNGAGTIQKYTPTGGLITQWSTPGPTGIAIDSANNVYVACSTDLIQKFTSTGGLITQFGSGGSGSGQFNGPTGVAVNTFNIIYVVDSGNNRVEKFGYDTPLPGWTINLFNTTGLVQTNVTDSNGNFNFGNLLPGQYTVSEVLQPSTINTTASSVSVTLQAAQTINITQQDGAFGNIRLGEIFGFKYLDVNQNGTFDDGDSRLANWTIDLTNSSGLVGSVLTDSSGLFLFSDLVPGNYTISEVLQPGYVNTSAKTLNVAVQSGQLLNVTNGFGLFGNVHTLAYVTNQNDNNVSVIDTTTNTVIDSIPVGNQPNGVAVLPNGTRAYAVNNGDNNVSVIDTTTNTVIDSIPVGSSPTGIGIMPNGTRVYVANLGDNTVSVIDTSTNTVVATVLFVGNNPHDVAVTPDGTKAYVPTLYAGTYVIDTSTNTVINTIPTGYGSISIAITPDGTKAYVDNLFANTVSAINISSSAVTTIPVGSGPRGVAVTPNSTRVYVTNNGGTTVSVIDTSTNTVIGSPITVGVTPISVAITADGTRAYVDNYSDGTVSIIDTITNTVIGSPIPVGIDPYGIATNPPVKI